VAAPQRSASPAFLRILAAIEDGLLVVLLALLITLAAGQIVLRNLMDTSLLWADPAIRVMVLWIGMIGAMVATRFDKQISVDAVSRFLPARWKAAARIVTDLFTSAVCAALAWNAARLIVEDRGSGLKVFGSVPLWVCELVLPLAFGVIALRYLASAVLHGKQALAAGDGER
jgi:TRAP-type C4-dicarboxylate transport system permease small subunit